MNVDETPIIFTATDKALIDAYKALSVFATDERWESLVRQHDPNGHAQAMAAIATVEQALSVAIRLTIIPTYTKVAFTINGGRCEGQTRDGAWGLQYAHRTVYPRRITTTMGFETWIGPDTNVESFEILEDQG